MAVAYNGSWDSADISLRLLGALEVAERAMGRLGAEGYADPESPEADVGPEKVISETALLLLAAGGVRDRKVRKRVDHLVRLLIPHARSDRVRAGVCLEPQLARDYAFAHACLSCLGYTDDDLDQLLGASLRDQASSGHERLAHRDLEQEWLGRLWNPSSTAADTDERLSARSMLGSGIDAIGCRRDDIYAFTHALLYFTDLGSRRHQLPRPTAAIVDEAETALARCLDDEDYDLGGEVLLTWPLLQQRWTATASFGFLVLARVEDAVGFLPAPIVKVDRYRSLAGEARSRYALATTYHTAYVMGLLCASSLGSGCLPNASVPFSSARPGATAALLAVLCKDGHERHWQKPFFELHPAQQEVLAPMLLNIGLRRATRALDLRALHSALQVGATYNLVSTAAARNAAALLQRVSTLSRLKPPPAGITSVVEETRA
jgi:hypothetical protein